MILWGGKATPNHSSELELGYTAHRIHQLCIEIIFYILHLIMVEGEDNKCEGAIQAK